jgi:uncharacterized membrane protein YtjA (UPF0391 family)
LNLNIGDFSMLRWALGFLVVAVIAAMLGFGGLSETSAGIAKVLFVVFMAGFVITLSIGLVAARRLTL